MALAGLNSRNNSLEYWSRFLSGLELLFMESSQVSILTSEIQKQLKAEHRGGADDDWGEGMFRGHVRFGVGLSLVPGFVLDMWRG